MQKRITSIIIGLILIFGIGLSVYQTSRDNSYPISMPPLLTSKFTLTQIATHNTRESCWSAINDNVYDLTSWIPNHPGGEAAILNLCGRDGSSDFNNQHGGQSKQESVLAGFKIGTLTK